MLFATKTADKIAIVEQSHCLWLLVGVLVGSGRLLFNCVVVNGSSHVSDGGHVCVFIYVTQKAESVTRAACYWVRVSSVYVRVWNVCVCVWQGGAERRAAAAEVDDDRQKKKKKKKTPKTTTTTTTTTTRTQNAYSDDEGNVVVEVTAEMVCLISQTNRPR